MPEAPPSSLRGVFATNVRARRKALRFSQEELADRAGVHRTYIGAIERSEVNVSIDNIARISAALGTSAASLMAQSNTT